MLLAIAACSDEVDTRAAMLPIAGEAVATRGRVEKSACVAGRAAADVAEELSASLPAAGWRELVVEPHPRIAGRWLVRGVRDGGLGLTGRIDDSAEGCGGARVSLGVHDVPAGTSRKTAGPTGLSRPSRLPDTPLTR